MSVMTWSAIRRDVSHPIIEIPFHNEAQSLVPSFQKPTSLTKQTPAPKKYYAYDPKGLGRVIYSGNISYEEYQIEEENRKKREEERQKRMKRYRVVRSQVTKIEPKL